MERGILETVDLTVDFPIKRDIFGRVTKYVRALDSVNIKIFEKDSVGIVGESGSGKTTLARCLAGLVRPTRGRILYKGRDIWKLTKEEYRDYRRSVQIVFQNPYTSLNPMMRVKDILKDVLKAQGMWSEGGEKRIAEILRAVGLREDIMYRYPIELSGGQAQRVAIARALAPMPKVLILDEPTSALDVSVQAQILELLRDLRREYDLTYIFISHDIGVVRAISNRIAVIYRGRVVEEGPTEKILESPEDEYTKKLIKDLLDLYGYLE